MLFWTLVDYTSGLVAAAPKFVEGTARWLDPVCHITPATLTGETARRRARLDGA